MYELHFKIFLFQKTSVVYENDCEQNRLSFVIVIASKLRFLLRQDYNQKATAFSEWFTVLKTFRKWSVFIILPKPTIFFLNSRPMEKQIKTTKCFLSKSILNYINKFIFNSSLQKHTKIQFLHQLLQILK